MKKNIMIALLIAFMTPFSSGVSLAILTTVTDGHYYRQWGEYCNYMGCFDIYDWEIRNQIAVSYSYQELRGSQSRESIGIIEFDISSLAGLYTSGQIKAILFLEVKFGELLHRRCLSIYSIQDENENGIIEREDTFSEEFIGEICRNLQPGDILSLDVTSAIEHDLFDPDQKEFSGFIIKRSTNWEGSIGFYDLTDPENSPRLNISEALCPSSVIYGTDSAKTQLLRSIRDNVLSQSPEGRELIKLYYQWSPVIVKAMEADEEFWEEITELIDGILPLVEGTTE